MKKFIVLAVIALIGACHLMHGDAHDSDYFSTGHHDDRSIHR